MALTAFSGLAFAGLAIGAVACIAATAWLAGYHARYGKSGRPIVVATGLTALWALTSIIAGTDTPAATLAETARNLGWLGVIYGFFAGDGRHLSVRPVKWVMAALAFVEIMHPVLLIAILSSDPVGAKSFLQVSAIFRLLVAIGGLVLLHNLYLGAATATRQVLRWPSSALAAMWLFDLNFYAIAYLSGSAPALLTAMRGLVAAVFAAVMVLGARKASAQLRFQPSRAVAFQSISLILIGCYLISLFALAQWLGSADGATSARFQIAFVAAAIALTVLVAPSRRMRAWLRITLLKHLFQHRYDYREEWLRFTRTIGQVGGSHQAALEERVVKAIADMTDSPGGLLLRPAESGGLQLAARWEWPTADVPAVAMSAELVAALEKQTLIVEFDDQRQQQGERQLDIPAWIVDDARAWALVPLLHFDRLVGLVVLARPVQGRRLDWEDFDLFRVAGQQVASYLAEHGSQEALAEAGRFDDFNRRIAFVMHDIKNLASQLSLLARNAELHADNPEFRSDMLITLRNAADKLNALLARLSRYGAHTAENCGPLRADQIALRIVDQFKAVHPIELVRSEKCEVRASAEPLEQALSHLVQNAIDASTLGTPVFISVTCDGMSAHVEVVDSGSGMTPEFVRNKLFKPFISSKPGGFGIGAYEARELIRAMNGSLEVESREGLGSRFVIRLPLAATSKLLETLIADDKRVA